MRLAFGFDVSRSLWNGADSSDVLVVIYYAIFLDVSWGYRNWAATRVGFVVIYILGFDVSRSHRNGTATRVVLVVI